MPKTSKALKDELEGLPPVEDFDLEEFLETVGPGTSVIDIFRVKSDGSTPRVGRVTLDVLREDVYGYLAETFGTGKYDLQFKGPDKRFRAQKRLAVEAPGPPPPIHYANGNGNGNGGGAERELMLALIATLRPPPPIDIGSLLQGLAAMKPAAPPPPPDPTAMFSAILTAVTAVKGSDDGGLDKFSKMVSIVKDMMPEAKGEENLYTAGKEIARELIGKFAGPSTPATPVNAPLQPLDAASPPPALPPSALTEETLNRWIVMQLSFLKEKAKQDKDPSFFAEYILDNGEEPGCAAVQVAMQRGVTFEMICEFDADIKSNPQINLWFRRLYDDLHAELFPAVDTAGGTGDVGDLAAHAPAGAGSDAPGATGGAPTRKSRKH